MNLCSIKTAIALVSPPILLFILLDGDCCNTHILRFRSSSSADQCVCLPGYKRSAVGMSCERCGLGEHCEAPSTAEATHIFSGVYSSNHYLSMTSLEYFTASSNSSFVTTGSFDQYSTLSSPSLLETSSGSVETTPLQKRFAPVLPCSERGRSSSCVGFPDSHAGGFCRRGHGGVLCSRCLLGYYKDPFIGECRECSALVDDVFGSTVFAAVTLASIAAFVSLLLQSAKGWSAATVAIEALQVSTAATAPKQRIAICVDSVLVTVSFVSLRKIIDRWPSYRHAREVLFQPFLAVFWLCCPFVCFRHECCAVEVWRRGRRATVFSD